MKNSHGIDLVAELKAAEEELAFEFSQDAWENALIEGFKNDWRIMAVLASAAGLHRALTNDDYARLATRASQLLPALSNRVGWGNCIRIWIANHAMFANEALWDLNYPLAKKLLKKGGERKGRKSAMFSDLVKEKRASSGARFISARDLDKKHDWKTVK